MVSYSITAKDLQGNPVDIIDELSKKGYITPNNLHKNEGYYDMHLDKMNPDEWAKVEATMRKDGYVVGVRNEDVDKFIKNHAAEGSWEVKEKTSSGAYTRIRRDLTEAEVDKLKNPMIHEYTALYPPDSFEESRKEVVYYGPDHMSEVDDYVAYISDVIPEAVIKQHVHYSENSGYDAYYHKGNESTPDGKPFGDVIRVNNKQLPKDFNTKDADNKNDVKVRLYLGEDSKKSVMYVKPDRFHSVGGNTYDVYLENKDYTVYDVDSHTKTNMNPKDIKKANDDAKHAYHYRILNKGDVGKYMNEDDKPVQADSSEMSK